MNYREQLQTEKWKSLRRSKISDDNFTCSACKNENIHSRCKAVEAVPSFGGYKLRFDFVYENQYLHTEIFYQNPADNLRAKRFIAYVYKTKSDYVITGVEIWPHSFSKQIEDLDTKIAKLKQDSSIDFVWDQIRIQNEISCLQNEKQIMQMIEPEKPQWLSVNCLQVHHKYYVINKMAWEYPPESLETLCIFCHTEYHQNYSVEVKDEKGNTITTIGKLNSGFIASEYFDII